MGYNRVNLDIGAGSGGGAQDNTDRQFTSSGVSTIGLSVKRLLNQTAQLFGLYDESDNLLGGFDAEGALLVPSDDTMTDIIKPINGKDMFLRMNTAGTGTFQIGNLEGGNNFLITIDKFGINSGSFGSRKIKAGQQTAAAFTFVEDDTSGMSLSASGYLRLQKSGNNRINLYDTYTNFNQPLQPPQYATGSLPTASTNEGRLVYDSTTKEMKYSNGTSWIAL